MKVEDCPVCGSVPSMIVGRDGMFFVTCAECGSCGPSRSTEFMAVKEWNRTARK